MKPWLKIVLITFIVWLFCVGIHAFLWLNGGYAYQADFLVRKIFGGGSIMTGGIAVVLLLCYSLFKIIQS